MPTCCAGLDDVALAGLVAKGLAEQIRHAPAGGQRRHVAGVAHVGDQADQVVLVRPHIPFGPAILLQIGAQVAVVELALAQFGGHVIELLAQRRIAGVNPRQRGGMQPFADVLAVPGLPARTLAVAFQQARRVELHQAIGFVGLDAHAHPAGQLHPVGNLKVLPVRDDGLTLSGSGEMVAAGETISAAAQTHTANMGLMPESGWMSSLELLLCFTSGQFG